MISLTGRPTGHVQLVDLALPVHVLDLPHPLLADDVDLHRAGRAAGYRSKNTLAPQPNITMAMPNGMTVQSSSSASDP